MTSESIALLNKYLSYASNASFNKFVIKEKDQITTISKDLDCKTPLNLMKYWVNCYNQTTSSRRGTAKIQAIPKKEASITFKKIFDTVAALDKSSQEYKNNAILTLGDYANLAREALKPVTMDRSSYNEPSSSDSNKNSKGISNNSSNNNNDDDDNSNSDSNNSNNSNNDNNISNSDNNNSNNDNNNSNSNSNSDNNNNNNNKKGKGISSSSVNNNNIEDELVRRLNERILHNKVLPKLNIFLTNKTINTTLLCKAADMISAENLDNEQLEFVKLCVSKSINLLNHHHVELYKQTLTYDAYNEIIQSAINIKSKLVITEYQFIADLFTKLRQFQFDRTCQSLIILLDNLKAAETDKCSEYYKLLTIVKRMVANFKVWKLEDDNKFKLAEMTYERKFVEILEILFEDEDVHVFDGELVSEATQEMIAMQGKIDFGRKINIIAKSRYNDVNLELSSIEFKVQGADDTTFLQQQSKNIRTNICILNKINSITNESNSIIYMDWRGREGYLALLHQNNDIAICQYVDKLYIPKNLMELDSCEKTIQNLWMWKNEIIKLCNKSKLAAHLQENKYTVAEIGSPHVVRSSPRLSSPNLSIVPFFTPTNKRTRNIMEENT